nr:MAG TPA: protein of unknown function DUF5055 [Caudoviricetes sp.]
MKIKFDGKAYELMYTRETVKQAEAGGFNLNALEAQPATQMEKLFYGAFAARCKGVKRKTVDDIWNHMTVEGRVELCGILADMYADAINSMADDGKKVTWETE